MAVWGCLGCASASSAPEQPAVRADQVLARKVLLISIDTLRADYLTVYEPDLPTSPNLAALGKSGAVFDDVIAQAGATLASHQSLFYSIYPAVSSVHEESTIPWLQVTAPVETLRDAGLRTAAFVAGGRMDAKFGLSRGFVDYTVLHGASGENKPAALHGVQRLEQQAYPWLDEHHGKNFFLFLHTYQVHCPYDPPEQYARKYTENYHGGEFRCGRRKNEIKLTDDYLRYVRGLYAGEVEYTDAFIGRLFDKLKALSIWDDTMIVVFSDHGELLGEHGKLGHGSILHTCLRVPLIVKIPGLEPSRVDAPVALIDVMPTIFAATGVEPPFRFQGQDLIPVMRGQGGIERERLRFASAAGLEAVYHGPWKAVFDADGTTSPRLYDLSKDRHENENLTADLPSRISDMQQAYRKMLADNEDLSALFDPSAKADDELDEALIEQLRSLGYIQ